MCIRDRRGDAAGGDPDQRAADEAADNQHLPGQMSREEAREPVSYTHLDVYKRQTLDYGAFHESLGAIDTNTIPRGGTNISSAIHEAQVALRRRPGSDRILILVTDGEDLEGSALAAAQAAAQEDGLKIYTVGVGSASGDLIPIPPEQGGGFVKDDTGAFVKSRLDETALKAIATATGGLYVPLGTQGEGLDTIFKTVLGPLAKHDLSLIHI